VLRLPDCPLLAIQCRVICTNKLHATSMHRFAATFHCYALQALAASSPNSKHTTHASNPQPIHHTSARSAHTIATAENFMGANVKRQHAHMKHLATTTPAAHCIAARTPWHRQCAPHTACIRVPDNVLAQGAAAQLHAYAGLKLLHHACSLHTCQPQTAALCLQPPDLWFRCRWSAPETYHA
jgi:hypothetical protein